MMSTEEQASIKEFHDFIIKMDMEIKNEDLVKMYLLKINLIEKGLLEDEVFEYALRVKSIYCFALSELNYFENAEKEILVTLKYFDRIYKDEEQFFNNIYYKKLIWNLMKCQFSMKKFDLARQNINLLLKYFNDNKIYHSWDKVIPKENIVLKILRKFLKKR